MRKTTNTSKLFITAAIVLCTSLAYMGCKKTEQATVPFNATDESTVSILKSWVIENKRSANSKGQLLIDSVLTYALWQKSVVKGVSNGKSVIYVPLHNSITGLEFFYDGNNQKVDSGNIITVEHKDFKNTVNEVFAIHAYYEAVILKQPVPQTFSGKIAAYSLTGSYLYDYTFGKGKIICRGVVGPKPTDATKPKMSGVGLSDIENCETYGYWAIFETYAVLLYTFEVCTVECTPPSLSISIGGQNFIRINCAGQEPPNGGYNGGGGSTATLESLLKAFDDSIEDSLVNDCLKTILAQIKALKSGKIAEIIKQFSGDVPNWDWKIKEGTLSSIESGRTNIIDGKIVTTLDFGKLRNATNLSAARTMIHESVHAYLTNYFRYDPINANKDYPGMVRAWNRSKHPNYNDIQHDQMEKSFVGEIGAALKQFGESLGLQIDDYVYNDMAWGGLDFLNNTTLTDTEIERINHRLYAEQTNTNSGTETKKGTKTCN